MLEATCQHRIMEKDRVNTWSHATSASRAREKKFTSANQKDIQKKVCKVPGVIVSEKEQLRNLCKILYINKP